MLIPYTPEYKKITMGFLSYRKELDDVELLNKELKLLQSEGHQIFLYKRNVESDIIGIIVTDVGDDFIFLRYLCINPAYRTGKNIYNIFDDLQNQNRDKHLLSSIEASRLVNNWKRDKKYTGNHNV